MILDTDGIKPTQTNRSFYTWNYKAGNPLCLPPLERRDLKRRHAARDGWTLRRVSQPGFARKHRGPPRNISILDDAVI